MAECPRSELAPRAGVHPLDALTIVWLCGGGAIALALLALLG
jgi:hypothetical protein